MQYWSCIMLIHGLKEGDEGATTNSEQVYHRARLPIHLSKHMLLRNTSNSPLPQRVRVIVLSWFIMVFASSVLRPFPAIPDTR